MTGQCGVNVESATCLRQCRVVWLTDRLDMTIVVDWNVKPQVKQTNKTVLRFGCMALVISKSAFFIAID